MAAGYSISIKALDEASAQIARINKALKDLEQADRSADQATVESARKSKNQFDELNKGVSYFSKNTKAELLSLAKSFADVGGKIGQTIEVLGSAFKLGGLALGVGLAAKGADLMGKALLTATNNAQTLADLSRSIGVSPEQIQRIESLGKFYGIAAQQTDESLKRLDDMMLKWRQGQIDPKLIAPLTKMGLNPNMRTDEAFFKLMEGMFHRTGADLAQGSAYRQIFGGIFGGNEYEKIIEKGEDYYKKRKEQTDQMLVQGGKTIEFFERLNDILKDVIFQFDQLKNWLANFVAAHPEVSGAAGAAGIAALGFGGWKLGKWALSLLGGAAGAAGRTRFPNVVTQTPAARGVLSRILGTIFGGSLGRLLGPLGAYFGDIGGLNEGEDEIVRKRNEEWSRAHPNSAPHRAPSRGVPAPSPSLWDRFKGIFSPPPAASAPIPPAPGGASNAPGGSGVHTVSAGVSREGKALLDTIAGTESPGYDVLYGGRHLTGYDWSQGHPGINVPIRTGPNAGKTSSAFGRYQFLKSTWNRVARAMGLKDISPDSQDKGAWHLAQTEYKRKTGRDLQTDLAAGRYDLVGPALHGQWTSLPGGIEQGTTNSNFKNRFNKNLGRYPAQNVMPPTPERKPEPPPAPAPDNTSSHEVTVSFNNLPMGTRVGVGDTRGNADLNIRSRYAMGVV